MTSLKQETMTKYGLDQESLELLFQSPAEAPAAFAKSGQLDMPAFTEFLAAQSTWQKARESALQAEAEAAREARREAPLTREEFLHKAKRLVIVIRDRDTGDELLEETLDSRAFASGSYGYFLGGKHRMQCVKGREDDIEFQASLNLTIVGSKPELARLRDAAASAKAKADAAKVKADKAKADGADTADELVSEYVIAQKASKAAAAKLQAYLDKQAAEPASK